MISIYTKKELKKRYEKIKKRNKKVLRQLKAEILLELCYIREKYNKTSGEQVIYFHNRKTFKLENSIIKINEKFFHKRTKKQIVKSNIWVLAYNTRKKKIGVPVSNWQSINKTCKIRQVQRITKTNKEPKIDVYWQYKIYVNNKWQTTVNYHNFDISLTSKEKQKIIRRLFNRGVPVKAIAIMSKLQKRRVFEIVQDLRISKLDTNK